MLLVRALMRPEATAAKPTLEGCQVFKNSVLNLASPTIFFLCSLFFYFEKRKVVLWFFWGKLMKAWLSSINLAILDYASLRQVFFVKLAEDNSIAPFDYSELEDLRRLSAKLQSLTEAERITAEVLAFLRGLFSDTLHFNRIDDTALRVELNRLIGNLDAAIRQGRTLEQEILARQATSATSVPNPDAGRVRSGPLISNAILIGGGVVLLAVGAGIGGSMLKSSLWPDKTETAYVKSDSEINAEMKALLTRAKVHAERYDQLALIEKRLEEAEAPIKAAIEKGQEPRKADLERLETLRTKAEKIVRGE